MGSPRTLLASLALVSVVTACGDGGGKGTADPDDPRPDVTGEPGGLAGDAFLEIDVSGGLIPPGALFAELPTVVVYADGTVLVPGPFPDSDPGPAVGPVLTGPLDDVAVDQLLQAAGQAGLLGEVLVDLDLPDDQMIADAPTTSIRLTVDGRERHVDVYALGLVEHEAGDRAAVDAFVRDAVEQAEAAATEAYDPVAYRVLPAAPYDGGGDVGEDTLTWPADLPPLTLDECTVIEGPDADAFEALLADATATTRWALPDQDVVLSIRPLLPHEDGCPA